MKVKTAVETSKGPQQTLVIKSKLFSKTNFNCPFTQFTNISDLKALKFLIFSACLNVYQLS